MTLYLIGLGLSDYKDVSVRGLEVIRSCKSVYLESYTSLLQSTREEMAAFFNRPYIIATREVIESEGDAIVREAIKNDVAVLVIGDVFFATTHSDLYLRARKAGVQIKTLCNASVFNAVGITGLELYKFGKITSVVFEDPSWPVQTHYDVLKMNLSVNLHTLALLDIKVAESSKEDLRKGITRVQEPRYMTIAQAISSFLSIEEKRKEGIFTLDTFCIGCARLGCDDFVIKCGKASELLAFDFGGPLHCLIIPGKLGHFEEEMMQLWK